LDDLAQRPERCGAAGLEDREHGPLRLDTGPGVRVVERREDGTDVIAVRAALHGESTLARGGNHLDRVEDLAHPVGETEAPQSGMGQDDGIELTVVNEPQAGLDVASDVAAVDPPAQRGELGDPTWGAGPHRGTGSELAEGGTGPGDDRISWVLAARDGGDR